MKDKYKRRKRGWFDLDEIAREDRNSNLDETTLWTKRGIRLSSECSMVRERDRHA